MLDYVKLKIKNNTLVLENEQLKSIIKDKLYKELINKVGEPETINRLKKENKRLRLQVKTLKNIIKEGR